MLPTEFKIMYDQDKDMHQVNIYDDGNLEASCLITLDQIEEIELYLINKIQELYKYRINHQKKEMSHE